jgi:adenosylmethionine-8-amino-7-oxononanoate aminotransferase
MDTRNSALWHPASHPAELKKRAPVRIVSADGVYLTDDAGRRLLDGNAGGLWCVNVGHNRPEMKAAITKQLDELEYFQLFDGTSHPRAEELATKLVQMTQPENMTRVFFTSGGSDSVEAALRLSRQYHVLNRQPERKKIISLKGSYHGSHFGASTVTGLTVYHRVYEPLVPGVIRVDMPLLYRNPWRCHDPDQLTSLCIDQLVDAILYEGPDTIAAIFAEPVSGPLLAVPPKDYWPRLRHICDQYGILLIADEVITGFGRSGSLFGSRGWGVVPDMMCLAKGLSSGYIPIGAVMIGARVEEAWEKAGDDPNAYIATGVTYAGHPVACAAGLAALNIVEKENLPENAKLQGEYLLKRLSPFVDKFRAVGDVRGKGLMMTLDLVRDKRTRESIDPAQGLQYDLAAAARRNGLMVRPYGPRITLSPPLIFSSTHCDELVAGLEKAFSEVERGR